MLLMYHVITPCVIIGRVLEQRRMLLSIYEAVCDIWTAGIGDCKSSYEDFRWAWFVGMYSNNHIPYMYMQSFKGYKFYG